MNQQYKIEIAPKIWDALQVIATRRDTTPAALIDVCVNEYVNTIAAQLRDERRNALISKIVALPIESLDDIERALAKLTDSRSIKPEK